MQIVKCLIEAGADINAKASNGAAPLHYAAEKGYLEMVTYLVDKNGNLEEDAQGCTPLHRAVLFGHLEVVKYLIDKKANIKAIDYDWLLAFAFCYKKQSVQNSALFY